MWYDKRCMKHGPMSQTCPSEGLSHSVFSELKLDELRKPGTPCRLRKELLCPFHNGLRLYNQLPRFLHVHRRFLLFPDGSHPPMHEGVSRLTKLNEYLPQTGFAL